MKQVLWFSAFVLLIAAIALSSGFTTGVQEVISNSVTAPVREAGALVDLQYYGELLGHTVATSVSPYFK